MHTLRSDKQNEQMNRPAWVRLHAQQPQRDAQGRRPPRSHAVRFEIRHVTREMCTAHRPVMSAAKKKDLTGAELGAWPQVQHGTARAQRLQTAGRADSTTFVCTSLPRAWLIRAHRWFLTPPWRKRQGPEGFSRSASAVSHVSAAESVASSDSKTSIGSKRCCAHEGMVACGWHCSAGACGGFGSALREYETANMRRLPYPWRALRWRRLPAKLAAL